MSRKKYDPAQRLSQWRETRIAEHNNAYAFSQTWESIEMKNGGLERELKQSRSRELVEVVSLAMKLVIGSREQWWNDWNDRRSDWERSQDTWIFQGIL